MTTVEFLSYLQTLKVKFWADGDRLCCRGPKAVLTAALQAELTDRKAEILALLHAANDPARFMEPALQPVVSRDGNLPLSFAQQRLWFLDQWEPGNAAYNVPMAIRLSGPLNMAALEQSLNEIVRRHETLRTSFAVVEGQPVQVIAPAVTLTLPVVGVRGLSESEREVEVRRLATDEVQRPFDLARGPLFRAGLLRLAEEEHVLLLTMHHIVSDGWSLGVLYQELPAFYQAFSSGKASLVPKLPIQYADFAVWQRQCLQGEVLEKQLLYWKVQLAGAPSVLNLPTDRLRPAVQTFRGERQSIVLPKGLTEALKELSRREGVTLFMTLLAAFQTMLYRYTGQEDTLVGTPIAGRNRAEIEGLIGFFVNTLVLRADLSGDPSFRELLSRVREVCLGAYAHQDLPFEKLVEELHPERDTSRNPLFQVVFALQNAPKPVLALRDLTLIRLEFDSGTVRFDLEVHLWETSEGLLTWFIYNTDLFDAATITRMAGHFQTLLEGMVADPDQSISTLPLLNEAERHQLLVEWNDTKRDYLTDKCIHELFEAQAERSPESVALVFDNQRMTYRELNSRANQLAHYLRQLGVGPEVLVGIYMERSLEMVVGLMGILKAGAAYLPLDANYPGSRLTFMLEDTRTPVLLTQKGLTGNFVDYPGRLVCLDSDWQAIQQESNQTPAHTARPDNLAYVIYTSGSTGKPKGVPVNHSNVVRLLSATDSWFQFDEADVWTLFHSIGFDFSVWELWGALFHGGRLVVVPYTVSRSPEDFWKLLCEQKVTVLNQTPSAFGQLVKVEEQLKDAEELSLRLIIFGGEALDPQLLKPWFDRHGDEKPRLVNMYGITETTVHVTYHPLDARDLRNAAGRVVGIPIPDLQVYVLDQRLQPTLVGVPGEIYVGGAGLARGYLDQPELTAERFIPNPYGDGPGSRLYKTGDLARYLPDGNLDFLGRIDHQIKIRGYRIEPEEIEIVLGKHPAVRQAAVLAREYRAGDKHLVAYVVRSSSTAAAPGELRSYLKAKLPDYMVPSAFVFLECLPLTPNGKVDRRALPAPDQSRPDLQEAFVAPRTPAERTIAATWAQVLKLQQVGIHDNFFDLGGHSLLATQVISHLREILQVDLPLRDLLVAPTVAGLAERIETILWAAKDHQAAAGNRLEEREEIKL